MDFLKYLLLFYCINIFAAQSVDVPEHIAEDLQKLLKLDFKERYQIFYYDKFFAHQTQLDPKKAQELIPHLHGVGLTIQQIPFEENDYLPQYECRMHLFVDLENDYWLPDYHYSNTTISDNYEFYVRHALGLEFFGGIDQQNMDNFASQSIYSDAYHQDNPEFALAGGIRLTKMLRFNEYKLLYLEYWSLCHEFRSLQDEHFAIWVEKIGGPDFKYSSSGPIKAKYFHHFALPQNLLQTSCPYLQRARAFCDWNIGLFNLGRGMYYLVNFEPLKDIMEC